MKIYRHIQPIWTDARGDIISLFDEGEQKIASVLLITCAKGAIRANHFHKEDSHYSYMLSGRMEYIEEPPPGEQGEREVAIVEKGDMVYTPSQRAHAMRFLQDSAFLALATKSRKEGAYEDDTVRIKVV